MRQRYPEVERTGGQVIAVGFAPQELLGELADDLSLPFPLLRDPDFSAYRAFGLRRGSVREIYGPGTIWTYVKLMLRGRRLRRTNADRFQLGGDFVIDGQGTIRLAHPSRNPSDRASVSRLLDALREVADHPP